MSSFKTSPDKCRLLHPSKPNTVFRVWQKTGRKCLHSIVFLMGFPWDPLGLLAFRWKPLKSKSPALPLRMCFHQLSVPHCPFLLRELFHSSKMPCFVLRVVCCCPLTFNSQQPHFHNTREMQPTKTWVCWFKAPIYWCHMISLSHSLSWFPSFPSSPLWYQILFDL